MHPPLNTGQCDIVVCIIGCEDNGHIPRLICLYGIEVCRGINGGVGGVGVTGEIHVLVDITNVLLHVVSYSWKFRALILVSRGR